MTEALIKRRQDARPYRIRNYKTLQQSKPKIFIYRLVFNQKPTDDQEQRDMDKINNTIYSITPRFAYSYSTHDQLSQGILQMP